MKPGSEDGGSKQEAVREETMEIVATATRMTDGMVASVKMLEYLEEDNLEVDKVAAVRFFSRALGDDKGPLPPHSPGHLPGLLQRLKDCMRMSDTVRNEAILSINRLIYHYASMLEPTEAEMTSLDVAIYALDVFIRMSSSDNGQGPNSHHLSQVLPTILSIYQEPGKRKKAQIHAASCLGSLARGNNGTGKLIDSGVMGMMMETVRVGKESPAVLTHTIFAIASSFHEWNYSLAQGVLDSGILEVIQEVFKRPNHTLDSIGDTWSSAAGCLGRLVLRSPETVLDVILSSGGLMEHLLEMGLGIPPDHDSIRGRCGYFNGMVWILEKIVDGGSESQLRRLMSKGSFFRFLAFNLDTTFTFWLDMMLRTVKACLDMPGTEHGLWLRRRLIDDSGITDAVRRISLDNPSFADQARHIFDTYLKNPLPPPPPSNLPSIIYTKNAP